MRILRFFNGKNFSNLCINTRLSEGKHWTKIYKINLLQRRLVEEVMLAEYINKYKQKVTYERT